MTALDPIQPLRAGQSHSLKRLIFVVVYVDASDVCNTAAFQLGQTAIGTTLATRCQFHRCISIARRIQKARPFNKFKLLFSNSLTV